MKPKRHLTAWMLALINFAAICNIKGLPLLSEYGCGEVVILIVSSLFFFIPISLVSAELATGWPKQGIYTWVTEALGHRWGFVAIWLQWVENVIWCPTLLAFIATSFAYIFNPDLASNKIYIFQIILITIWAVTFLNFFGMRISGWISSLGALFGTILPILLLSLLGTIWLFRGLPSQITFSWSAFVPNFSSFNDLVLLSGTIFSLSGMEMSAVHAKDVRRPETDYPRAILLSVILIFSLSTLGALTISMVVPTSDLQLVAGGMIAFKNIFATFGMSWAVPILAVIVTFGAFGMMNTWIMGPSRGLLAAAQHGNFPPLLQKTNKHGMPVFIFILQAVIVTGLSVVFLYMPNINTSYWILMALAVELYMMMYLLMFISAILLRYKKPDVKRVYRIPCGNIGMWIASSIGFMGACFAMSIAAFPPSQLETGNHVFYEIILIGGVIVFCAFPLVVYQMRKPAWKQSNTAKYEEE